MATADDKCLSIYNQALPTNQDELFILYDQWADSYDQEAKQFGYKGPQVAASILADHLPDKNARILDFCSGTGLVGEQLKTRQFINIDAIDMSPNSLKVSEEKQVYKTLICSEIGSTPLDIKCDTYGGLVCCGSFTPGHLNQSCFPEMIRIVKPGGIIVISMREEYLWTAKEFQNNQLEEAIQDMVAQEKWILVARKTCEGYFHDKTGVTFVFRTLFDGTKFK
ncbi:methyltransferase-like protein 27 [Amphiura filiformis]|uniref:methyltransferase-like protein 27 n=1 Tax=Amphiura filiformis TaxID=82378 RepID=UPI003B21ACA0